MRLSPYEPEIDLCEPSDGYLHVGTSIQSRGRRGSEGGGRLPIRIICVSTINLCFKPPGSPTGIIVGLPREPGRMVRQSSPLGRADCQVEAGGRVLGGGGGHMFVGRWQGLYGVRKMSSGDRDKV